MAGLGPCECKVQIAECKMDLAHNKCALWFLREEGKFGSGHSTGRVSLLHAPIYHDRLLEELERKVGFWASVLAEVFSNQL